LANELLLVISLVIAAFAPPLIYMYVVRNTETCRREPWSALIVTFLYGGTVAVLISILLESAAQLVLYNDYSPLTRGFWNFEPYDLALQTIIMAVIIAPIVEETAKASGVPRRRILELEDGFVYGAAVGLGFAATENMLYLISALTDSVEAFILTAIVRAFTSTLLHASASAIAGFGIALAIIARRQGRSISWLPYLGLAMLLHAVFNLFASMGDLVPFDQTAFALLGLGLALVLAVGIFIVVRRRIRALDTQAPCVE